jgi:chromosome segregation ATPase
MSGQEQSSLIGWVLAGFTTITTALSSALSLLYRNQIKDYERERAFLLDERQSLKTEVAKIASEVDNCQREHYETKVQFAKVEERLRLLELKGCMTPLPGMPLKPEKDT